MMKKFLGVLKVTAGGLVGMIIGGLIGFFGMFGLAQLYVANGGDSDAAAALAFFTILTVPGGALLGAILGGVYCWRKLSVAASDRRVD